LGGTARVEAFLPEWETGTTNQDTTVCANALERDVDPQALLDVVSHVDEHETATNSRATSRGIARRRKAIPSCSAPATFTQLAEP
jgi:hypothetical protein